MEKKTHEVFFQRFVSKKGTFRKIHAVGTAMESVKAMGGDSVRTSHFDQYVEFDELGIFNGAPVDPVSLVPLYPGRAVKLNEAWFPEVPVKIDMGEGLAHFMFVIDSVYRSCGNDLLARVRFRFDGDLRPALSLPGAKVTVSGSGRFTWNCTVHQRRDTHLSAVYMAAGARDTVRRFITAEDSLAVYRERRLF